MNDYDIFTDDVVDEQKMQNIIQLIYDFVEIDIFSTYKDERFKFILEIFKKIENVNIS